MPTLDSPTSPIDKHAPPFAEHGKDGIHSKALVATPNASAVGDFSECQVEELDDKLEIFFRRIIPRTPRGSLDIKRCDHRNLCEAVKGANIAVAKRFEAAWNAYAQREDGSEVPMVKTLRETCGDLTDKFSGAAQCVLDEAVALRPEGVLAELKLALEAARQTAAGASEASLVKEILRDKPDLKRKLAEAADPGAVALISMASLHGKTLLDLLEGVVEDARGAYYRGPQKEKKRILAKALDDYSGNVACVVDVERATGIFDSLEDLHNALKLLRDAHQRTLVVRRCKDSFFDEEHKHNSGYRDYKFNVEVTGTGFVGELQLNLRRIVQIKNVQHRFYAIERALKDEDALKDAITGLGLQSEQVLRLFVEGDGSVLDVCGSQPVLREALQRAIPQGCTIANVYIDADGSANVCLGVSDVSAIAKLRDDIILCSAFEEALNDDDDLYRTKSSTSSSRLAKLFRCCSRGKVRVRVDRGAFMECYARMMMRFDKPTPHQREKLAEVRGADAAVLLAPAGGGKTFVAIQRMLQVLQEDPSATIFFVARNEALALFACKWLVVASRKKAEHVVERVHVLVEPFANGPMKVGVAPTSGRRRLVFDGTRPDITKYALVVVDEAHHLVNDSMLRDQLAAINAAASKLLFLGDASQATTTLPKDAIARALVDLPPKQEVKIATLSEVVRSTKRIVEGAAAFQLQAGRKAETSTHGASAGPPLVARIFELADGDDEGERYAREVAVALETVQRQLVDLDDLDDRVAVVCPDDVFVKMLRGPLESKLSGFEIVDAATASAALPRGETEACTDGSKEWLVVDRIANMDGLERLVVICVGLDEAIDGGADVRGTRSRLYRAMTRAQLAVAVVNKTLPGGWLEFLGRVELSADEGFDDAAERRKQAETAADDVVISFNYNDDDDALCGTRMRSAADDIVIEATTTANAKAPGATKKSDEKQGTSESKVVSETDKSKSPDAATQPTPDAAPIKVTQSIWDTRAVATASRGDLRFMPFFDPSKLGELKGHIIDVRCVAVFPDGKRVVSGSEDCTLKVWDVATGKCLATLEVEGHSQPVWGVAVFPDGRRLASCDGWISHGRVKVWDVATGECVATLEGHLAEGTQPGDVRGVAISPGGRRIVSGSCDKTLKVWDVNNGKWDCVATLEGH